MKKLAISSTSVISSSRGRFFWSLVSIITILVGTSPVTSASSSAPASVSIPEKRDNPSNSTGDKLLVPHGHNIGHSHAGTATSGSKGENNFKDLKSYLKQFHKEQDGKIHLNHKEQEQKQDMQMQIQIQMRQLKVGSLKNVRSVQSLEKKLSKSNGIGIEIKPSDYTTAEIFIPMCINYLLDDKITSDNLISIMDVASFFEYFCDELNIEQCKDVTIHYYQLSLGMQLMFIYSICGREMYDDSNDNDNNDSETSTPTKNVAEDEQYQSCVDNLRDQVRVRNAYGMESSPEPAMVSQVTSKVEKYCVVAYRTTIYYIHETDPPSISPTVQSSTYSSASTSSAPTATISSPTGSTTIPTATVPFSSSPSKNELQYPSMAPTHLSKRKLSTSPHVSSLPSLSPSSSHDSSDSPSSTSNNSFEPSASPSSLSDAPISPSNSSREPSLFHISPSPSSPDSNRTPNHDKSLEPSVSPSSSPSTLRSKKESLSPFPTPSSYPSSIATHTSSSFPTTSFNTSVGPTSDSSTAQPSSESSSPSSSSSSNNNNEPTSISPSLRPSVKPSVKPTLKPLVDTPTSAPTIILQSQLPSISPSMNPSSSSSSSSGPPTHASSTTRPSTSPTTDADKSQNIVPSAAPSKSAESRGNYSPSIMPSSSSSSSSSSTTTTIPPTKSPTGEETYNTPSLSPSTFINQSIAPSNEPSKRTSQNPDNNSNQPSSEYTLNPSLLSPSPSTTTTSASASPTEAASENGEIILRDHVVSFTYMLGYIDPQESQKFHEGNNPSTLDSLTYSIISTLYQPTTLSSQYLIYGISDVEHKTILPNPCTADFDMSTNCVLVVSEIRFPHEIKSISVDDIIKYTVHVTMRESMEDSSFRDRVGREEVIEVKYVQDGEDDDEEPELPSALSRSIGGGAFFGIVIGAAVLCCVPFVAMHARSSRNERRAEDDDSALLDDEEDLISIDPLNSSNESA